MVQSSQKFVKELRSNMTEAERLLWHHLRHRRFEGLKFRRQQSIGNYIVDFLCFELRFIIEVDGGQHLNNPSDQQRDAWLSDQGFTVFRFWNHEVLKQSEVVLEALRQALYAGGVLPVTPHPTLSRKGRGKMITLNI